MSKRSISSPVWIFIALALGLLVGLGFNMWWSSTTWLAMGVNDPAPYLAHTDHPGNTDAGAVAAAARFTREVVVFAGDLFIRLLRMLAVPLVLFSLCAAVAGVATTGGMKLLGRLGLKTSLLFALMATIAVTIALLLANIAQPGRFVDAAGRQSLLSMQSAAADARIASYKTFDASQTVWSQLLDIFATNPFKALADGNMLQVVVIGILLGVGLAMVDAAKRGSAVAVIEAISEAMLHLVGLLMRAAPIAVFCLTVMMAATLGWSVLASVAWFCGVVILGMAIILFVQYPILLATLGRGKIGIGAFFRAMAPAQALAFGSSSSSATMPVTIECCDRMGVSPQTSRFVVPLGTTINMDGTAMYQVLCVTFLAQLYGVDLSFSQQIGIAAMAIAVAVGSPGLPGASLVLMVGVLQYAGVPPQGLAIILAVDRVLDMARTVVNVSGDAVAAVIVDGKRPAA